MWSHDDICTANTRGVSGDSLAGEGGETDERDQRLPHTWMRTMRTSRWKNRLSFGPWRGVLLDEGP